MSTFPKLPEIIPGTIAAIAITALSQLMVFGERTLTGFELLDGLVIAILLGTLWHTVFGLRPLLKPGVAFSSKVLLELAIVFLGASVSVATVADAGSKMILVIVGTVLLSLMISYGICRVLGLHDHLATLVACGNSICGNSAIVAAAPVIGARSDDVAASIAFTAALGIVVVLVLPPLFPASHLSEWQYGVLAGMTVYAVPQVLAATAPIGVASVQIGTLVKLMRVLMLGPVVLLLRLKKGNQSVARPSLAHLVPWFIVGFFGMMFLRSLDLIPTTILTITKAGSTYLTIVSMAALGLSVNMRTVFASGGRVLLAGILSMLALATMSVVGLMILHAN
ncbi:putative sulfate exporter family transporter (plasmid) [Rhizobium grahamii]|uniref:Putative sulfate exporter family transporter n=1 Tax=Rhizobium grahamii TaxID=1120045 RepID=A0A5Q0CGQ0_9HYPH|nr:MULTISPECIES: putative sulfate exporter family transporter [Rhizobium]QFY63261.1 putative sulfate exporter family transporter [Rhizobium grahamii]QRM51975.1 putative sulfate exporter family transporter [Rhizobium sp. BG6]